MTPEEQIIYAIKHLEQTNQVINDHKGKGSASYQLRAFFTDRGGVPGAEWSRGWTSFGGFGPNIPGHGLNRGVRSAVRV